MTIDSVPTEAPSRMESVLEQDVIDPIRRFAVTRPELVRTAFLTGSYVAGTWNRRRPNLNAYFIAHPYRDIELRWAAAELWASIRERVRGYGYTLLLDCHPFTVSSRLPAEADLPLITITSKVFEGEYAGNRYRLPPTIGSAWLPNIAMLAGDRADLECLRPAPTRDGEWIRTLHRALSHYRGILDHLPWALDCRAAPSLLVEESSRYAEETIKDALALGLTAGELAAGRHTELLVGWQTRAAAFIAERFGPAGTRAAQRVAALKVAAAAGAATLDLALDSWRTAREVTDWAWTVYLPVALELCPDLPDLLRVDSFL